MNLPRQFVIFINLGFCLFLGTPGALAQTATTGMIEGRVTDANGAVVPNVPVIVTSPNLIRTQSARSDVEGSYRIFNLPPGKYSVIVEPTRGFAGFEQSDVQVSLSRTTSLIIRLQPAMATAKVTVNNSSSLLIDSADNTTGTNVSTEQFSNFVTQRTVQSLYTIAPTATRSGLQTPSGRDRDPSVAGSSGLENTYIFDGVNTTDPVFGGSGANLPFEFIQEVEIKTGAYGAEYGLATGGIFNILTKSGGNEFHGDVFAYFASKGFVRETKHFPFTGSAPDGFSEVDAGLALGGPLKKDRLWFFAAVNPQWRKNHWLTQTLRQSASNRATTPFYAGKLTFAFNQNTLTASSFADFTTIKGYRVAATGNPGTVSSGFGADPNSFKSETQLGGHNYAVRLNSQITPRWIGEFSFAAHFQRNYIIPDATVAHTEEIRDGFAIVRNGLVLPVTETDVDFGGVTGLLAFVDGRGGSLERNFIRQGFGQVTHDDRHRFQIQARFQSIFVQHKMRYGFEFYQNKSRFDTRFTGPRRDFGAGVIYDGFQVRNNFGVCTVQSNIVVCPAGGLTNRVNALIASGKAPDDITSAVTNSRLTAVQLGTNPFLVLSSTSIHDTRFSSRGRFTRTYVESFYFQDDIRLTADAQVNLGVRWDYQQAKTVEAAYLRLNSFKHNLQPRLGFSWDLTGQGRSKLFVNYARLLEAPMPLSLNTYGGVDNLFVFAVAFVNRLNAPEGSRVTAPGGSCCGVTPVDADLKPQTVNEITAGLEYEIGKDLVLGFRGLYRAQDTVIEDGSFDEGSNYFLFNPGESATERMACTSSFGCFGRARRYYRALEITATRRFKNNYQFLASYVYSSLIGNYEGLMRNDRNDAEQTIPNLTSLFDLQSLLSNTYGRLPVDRPHQFKGDASYRTSFGVQISASVSAQSGIPFNALTPHPLYGDNEGFAVPRGTASVPIDAPGGVTAGSNRTPSIFQLDLGGRYTFKIEERQLTISVDWFNVANAQRAIRVDETLNTNRGIPGANFISFINPFYGQGTKFQFPSFWRAGIKFTF